MYIYKPLKKYVYPYIYIYIYIRAYNYRIVFNTKQTPPHPTH